MKVTLFQSNGKFQARTANNNYYYSEKGEKLPAFKKRIKAIILDEEMETASFTIMTPTKMKAFTTEELESKANTAEGIEGDFIEIILADRAALARDSKVNSKTTKTKGKRKVTKKAAPTKQKANPRTVEAPYTLKDAEAEHAEALENKSKYVKFIPYGSTEKTIGLIKGVTFDRKAPLVMYRILLEDGSITHKRPTDKTVKFNVKKDERFEVSKSPAAIARAEEVAAVALAKEALKEAKDEAKETFSIEKAEIQSEAKDKIEKAKAAYLEKVQELQGDYAEAVKTASEQKQETVNAHRAEVAERKAATAKEKNEAALERARIASDKALAKAEAKKKALEEKIAKFEAAAKVEKEKLKDLY